MLIRIMRHGDAPVSISETGQPQRQLSQLGESEVATMADWLSHRAPTDLIINSPLLRAKQTANIVKSKLSWSYDEQIDDVLLPEANPSLVSEYIESLPFNSILLISHMPLVANLLQKWIPTSSGYFATTAIAELQIASEQVQLLQFVCPDDI